MYQVKAKNKRGYIQGEVFTEYRQAFEYGIECLDSDQYSTIVILKHDDRNNEYFLHRIIK